VPRYGTPQRRATATSKSFEHARARQGRYVIATANVLHWLGTGFKESLAMVWMTWWPLVLGFTLAGVVQGMLPRAALRRELGSDSARSHAKASLLGALSSSCSYAASAMARALFARGASWTNAIIFMVASTNLVIELGVVLFVLLGWPFVLAQLVGGLVMVAFLIILTPLVFRRARVESLTRRVADDAATTASSAHTSRRERVGLSARYTMGDLTMVRKELVFGFVVAGFLSVHVPPSWWSHVFINGHGAWTVVENAVLAPLVAVLAFVCSVGNVPLAATLWAHGVAFGGVVAFIFADLVTLPLLVIYRRYYGTDNAWRLFALLWTTASVAGLIVDGLFHLSHLTPSSRHVRVLSGQFPLGVTLVLNVLALVVLVCVWRLARSSSVDHHGATDPICGMTVDPATAPASAVREGKTYYFCSLRCRDTFNARGHVNAEHGVHHLDPVCAMHVAGSDVTSVGPDGVAYYFCSEECRSTFLHGASPANHTASEDEHS
jgi:YHS domain-containing protein